MSTISLNGNDLMRLRLRLPLYGAWVADCLHADPSLVPDVGAAATIVLESQTFVGTVVRTSYLQDLGWDSWVVGGGGGLSVVLPAAQFVSPDSATVLADALRTGGETRSSSVSSDVLSQQWASWRRSVRSLGQELDQLRDVLSRDIGQPLSWRVLSDGTVWIGEESWSESSVSDYDAMSGDASAGCHVIAAEDPTVLPGQVWVTGERIGEVVHSVDPESTRTELWVSSGRDRDAGSFDALQQPVDMLACYQYRVISQNSDKTLELRTTDVRLPDLSKVPIRFGLPGTSADIPQGCVVLVSFAGGDGRDPSAVSWVSGTASNLRIIVDTLLELGASPASSMVALADLVDNRISAIQAKLDSLIGKYDAHVHPGVLAGPASTLVTLSTETPLGSQASVAATKVKAT